MKNKTLALTVGLFLVAGLTSCGEDNASKPASSNPHTQMNQTNQEWTLDKASGYVKVSTTRGEVPCIFLSNRAGFALDCDWNSLKTVNDDGSKYQVRENAKALNVNEGWLKFNNSEVWCITSISNYNNGGYSCDWSTKDKRPKI